MTQPLSVFWVYARAVFDPRGRSDRVGFFATACIAALFANGMTSFAGPIDLTEPSVGVAFIYGVALWMFAVPHMRRLHDLGLSGWYFWVALPLTFMWSAVASFGMIALASSLGADAFTALDTGQPLYLALVCLIFAPPLAASLWLCGKRGLDRANRYGPAPGTYGLSEPEYGFQGAYQASSTEPAR